MIRYRPTTCSRRFRTITVNVASLDKMIRRDGFPFHIGADGRTDDRLPWQVQAYHAERYCDRYVEVSVDEIAQRPVVRLSIDDERAAGRSPITVENGLETLAVFRDLGIQQIDIEVPWEQATRITSPVFGAFSVRSRIARSHAIFRSLLNRVRSEGVGQ